QAICLCGPYTQPAFGHFFPAGCSSHPSPDNAPKKQPKALSEVLSTPGTFSQTTMDGLSPRISLVESISFANLTNSRLNCPRSSFKEFLNPATENAWQGVPPTRTSGASTTSCWISA